MAMVSVTPAVLVITMSDGEEMQKRRHCTQCALPSTTVCVATVYKIVYTTHQWNDTTYLAHRCTIFLCHLDLEI